VAPDVRARCDSSRRLFKKARILSGERVECPDSFRNIPAWFGLAI